jgi:hypothetical protein
MSGYRSRAHTRERSYAARVQRPKAYRAPRVWPAWLSGRRLAATLLLSAEVGHLVAAATEWPGSLARGLFHVLVAGLLGALGVGVYFGGSRLDLGLGLGAVLVVPACWLAGALAGVSPYLRYPSSAAFAHTAVELAAAAVLAAGLRSAKVSPQRAVAR